MNLILPQIQRKVKCGIITTLISSFIGLAYEGISSFLHHKGNKALHKAARAMDSKCYVMQAVVSLSCLGDKSVSNVK